MQIAQDVQVQNSNLRLGSVFELQATAKPGVKPEDLEAAINAELEKLRNEGPTQTELERARNVIETRTISNLERLGGFGGLADRLNQYNQFLHDPGYLPKDLERYNRATTADLKRVAEEKLKTSARAVVYGLPGERVVDDPPASKESQAQEDKGKAVAGVMADEPWRANPPPAGALSKLSLPLATSFRLANGLTVLLVEQHQLPLVATRIVTLSGSDANPIEKPGLSSFTTRMLPEGTERRSSLQVADDAAQIGASVRTFTVSDDSIVAIRTLKPNVDAALDLLSDVVLHPKFDPEEIDRIRKIRETDILQIQDDPMQLAVGVLLRSVYGPAHPYGYRDEGTAEANRLITRDDLRKMWQSGYAPANAVLVFTGDLTSAEARTLAEKYFASWQGTTGRHEPPPVNAKTSRAIYLVDKPGAAQTFLLVAGLGVPRSTPDFVPLEVMNNILGGLYSSRINMNLREEHGYTYGCFSFFLYRRAQGLFAAGGGMRSDATAPAVQEMLKEIERIRTAPPTAEELKLSKGAFSLSLAGLFESSEQTANTVGDLFTYDLPLDYYQKLPAKIDAVTAADVQRMAATYLHPETSVVIGAGDRAKVEDPLKKLAIGPVELRDADGNPVKAAGAGVGAH